MIAPKDQHTDVVRATSFELVDDEGKVQGVFEATPDGPRLVLYAPDGTPRVQVSADEEGGAVHVYGTEGHSEPRSGQERGNSEPMASLQAWRRIADVAVNQVCDLGGEQYVTTGAALTTKDGGGRIEIYDDGPSLAFEFPHSAAGFLPRLREQIAKAVEAENGRIAPDRLERLYCDAAECVQTDVGRMASELAKDADGSVLKPQ